VRPISYNMESLIIEGKDHTVIDATVNVMMRFFHVRLMFCIKDNEYPK
jgi:hypothetical protein